MFKVIVARKVVGSVETVDVRTLTKGQRATVTSVVEWITGETIRPNFVDVHTGGANLRVSVRYPPRNEK